MQNILNWFIFSSKNPEKISLTLKSALTGLATFSVVLGLHTSGIDFGPTIDSIVNAVTSITQTVSAIAAAYGLCRKLYLTIIGENPVIN